VKEGQDVEQGQIIARADSTGYVTAAHLHFQIQETGTNWYTQSIQISFSDVDVLSKEKDGVPKQGKSYKSDNTLADSHLEVRGKILFMRSYFDENGRLCPGDLCAINPDGTGKTIIFQSAHIKLRSAPIEIEGKRDYSVSSPYLVVSSDGKNMAMTWWKEIIIGGLDAKELNRIPIPESIEPYLSLAWSPDRKKFALIASTKNEINSIYIVNHDGSGLTKVATGFIDLAWSPDSQEIIFNTNSGMLSTVRVDGANRRDLGIIGFTPAWSPDKKKIAYVSAVSSPPKKPVYDLYVLEIESGRVNRLTSESPGVNILNPIWSPDGKKIAFEKLVGLGETVDAIVWSRRAGTSSTIWVIDADGGNPVQLTPLEKENSEMLNILLVWVSKQSNPLTEDMTIAWGKKVSPEFKAKVMEISSRLGVDVNYLMAAMAFETGRTFDPSITNPNSGATGLIQFMPSTALNLGTTTDALRVMGAVEQLDYVEKYFQPYRGRLATLEDVYMAILWPQAIGKPVDYVLFAKPSIYYTQNSGLDLNKDGQVTKAEASAKVKNSLMEGLDSSNKG
ncbi:MAG: PD40 domain-containing protein, partial [Chloroflexi bacterium]|nr:PD40 domain-containing protein [Chloroflexota bacterium]